MNYTEKNKFIDSICGVGLMLLLTEVFYWIVNDSYTVYVHNLANVTKVVQIFGAIFMVIAVIVLIRAYRKDSIETAVYGLEFLVLAILAALLPGAYISFPFPFNMIAKLFPFMFLAYYVAKFTYIMYKTFGQKKGKRRS